MTRNYDDWKQEVPEDPPVVGKCAYSKCREPIATGEEVYVIDIDHEMVHPDCWHDYTVELLGAEKKHI